MMCRALGFVAALIIAGCGPREPGLTGEIKASGSVILVLPS